VAGTERFVEFRSGKLVLRGMLHLPPGRARVPGVLFCHGFTGQRMESHFIFVKAARALAEAGVASLRFDFAGSGESDGRFEEMSVLTEFADSRVALSFLARRRRVDRDRLGVLGLSLGGCVAAMLLEDARLRSGVLWSAVAEPGLVVEAAAPPFAEREIERRGFAVFGAHKVGRRFAADAREARPLDGVRRSRADLLIVHGTADPTVPVEHARMFEEAARSRGEGPRTEIVLVQGAGHTFELVPHEEEVVGRAVEWFRETLV
jgi:hypothetical protein